jgi:hypothetical protein
MPTERDVRIANVAQEDQGGWRGPSLGAVIKANLETITVDFCDYTAMEFPKEPPFATDAHADRRFVR